MIKIEDIPGYGVTETGVVYSYKRNIWLKPSVGRHGYKTFNLCLNGKQKSMLAHRLVAIAYIDNPDNKPEVNHIDSNILNNSNWNLEWVTHKENMIHMVKAGRNYSAKTRRKWKKG